MFTAYFTNRICRTSFRTGRCFFYATGFPCMLRIHLNHHLCTVVINVLCRDFYRLTVSIYRICSIFRYQLYIPCKDFIQIVIFYCKAYRFAVNTTIFNSCDYRQNRWLSDADRYLYNRYISSFINGGNFLNIIFRIECIFTIFRKYPLSVNRYIVKIFVLNCKFFVKIFTCIIILSILLNSAKLRQCRI